MGQQRMTSTFDYAGAISGCAAGDRRALQRLYEEEAARMIAVAQRVVRRRELAEEVVQETFIQIWRKASSFDPAAGSARAWIYTIVRNRALNLVRDGRREDLAEPETLALMRDQDHPGEDAFGMLAESSRLKHCLETLDRDKRDSLLMAYVSGFSHGEIAGRLKVPVGTAKAWVRRGLVALKDCMS
jgi:RNA polymerase sigma-70 factor (ECF subfamily)